MKNLFLRACLAALALFVAPAFGQSTPSAPLYKDSAGRTQEGIVTARVTLATTSTGQRGSATSSAVTPTSGAATFAAGVATIGPLNPELGRPVHVRLFGTWTGSAYVATSGDNCVTLTPLTVAGAAWATYTANANEDVDVPYRSGIAECLVATVTSGTLTYSLDQ